jgi:hypothetical protein
MVSPKGFSPNPSMTREMRKIMDRIPRKTKRMMS